MLPLISFPICGEFRLDTEAFRGPLTVAWNAVHTPTGRRARLTMLCPPPLAPPHNERLPLRRPQLYTLASPLFPNTTLFRSERGCCFLPARQLAVPTEIDALIDLHIRAIDTWLDTVEAGLQQGQ